MTDSFLARLSAHLAADVRKPFADESNTFTTAPVPSGDAVGRRAAVAARHVGGFAGFLPVGCAARASQPLRFGSTRPTF